MAKTIVVAASFSFLAAVLMSHVGNTHIEASAAGVMEARAATAKPG